MITKEQFDNLEERLFPENNPTKMWDVMVGSKTKTAISIEDQWYLFPVNFKFGSEEHLGQPYLSMDQELIEIVTEDYLNSLSTWAYEHESGLFTIKEK